MANVLIPTKPDDTHALFVKLALNKRGHRADLWFTADFPARQTHAFEISQQQFRWRGNGIEFGMDNPHYDVVWYRRPAKPVLPDILHPDDVKNASKENLMFYHAMWQAILPDAKWINPVNHAARANAKILQLSIARDIGLKIPLTLIGNDPGQIKGFLRKLKNNAIYKCLYPVAWFEPDAIRLAYTHVISHTDLPSDPILRMTPGIFQEKIDKAYELRVTYFGEHYVAVRIDSQAHPMARMDWRAAPVHELALQEVRLPSDIDSKCRLLMKKLDLVFGCLDLIVTRNNEYYFLEINEQGQFLWIEEINPKIKMLQAFVDFIIASGCNEMADAKQNNSLSLLDFMEEVEKLKSRNMSLHQTPGRNYSSRSS